MVNVLAIPSQESVSVPFCLVELCQHIGSLVLSNSSRRTILYFIELFILCDRHQKTVVHQVELLKESDVLPHRSKDLVAIFTPKIEPHSLWIQFEQIFVFQSRGRLEALFWLFDVPIDQGTFQVENPFNLSTVSHSVAHNDELHGLLVFHLDCVNAVNASKKALICFRNTLEVWFHDAPHGIEIRISHRFNDELLILAEKEETSRFTLRFAWLEHHVLVRVGVQRL